MKDGQEGAYTVADRERVELSCSWMILQRRPEVANNDVNYYIHMKENAPSLLFTIVQLDSSCLSAVVSIPTITHHAAQSKDRTDPRRLLARTETRSETEEESQTERWRG